MERATEVSQKLDKVRAYLKEKKLRGALFASQSNFGWITGGGRNHVGLADNRGVAAVLVTTDAAYMVTDNIERRRIEEEELGGLEFRTRWFAWWSGTLIDTVLRIVPIGELAADIAIHGTRPFNTTELLGLRNPLLPDEIANYRTLGADVATVLTHVAQNCRPGLSENQLAGMLMGGLADFGITPVVTLVAVDDRTQTRRHPLPTDQKLERYAMLVVVGRRHGLHASATRLVHFGPVPADLQARLKACATVDAALLAATRPGARLNEIFQAGQTAYAAVGFPTEWQHHHQGGATGYEPRDVKASPSVEEQVRASQAFAWNPSIAGVKVEDTVITTRSGVEILTATPDLPTIEVKAEGKKWVRPAILER